jgi:tRNA threonylcarbamoyladenosine biosynthesis protein TsaB
MAKILLIETSSEVCSVAIGVEGSVLAIVEDLQTSQHVALLTLQISTCCEKAGISLAELDAVALSRGPGAYTSLRVGASVAKGICYALEKPLIAVDTLKALAFASREEEKILDTAEDVTTVLVPLLDARRQEVWLGVYGTDLREIAPAQPLVLENNSFEKLLSGLLGEELLIRAILSGNGMEKTRSGNFLKGAVFSKTLQCSAGFLATLAEQQFQNADFQDIAYFEPYYLKPPNITTSTKPLF